MLRNTIRSALISLSSIGASSPIEIITLTFIIITLAYFQLLHAIKGSEFFQLPQPAPSPKPIQLVRLSNPPLIDNIDNSPYIHPSPPSPLFNSFKNSNAWVPLPVTEFRNILDANAREGGYVFAPENGGNSRGENAVVVLVKQLILLREEGEGEKEWLDWLLNEVGPEIGGHKTTYRDICHQCDISLEPHPLHSSQSTLTMYLRPPTPDTPTLTYLNHLTRLPAFTSSATNTTFKLLHSSASSWGFLSSLDGAGLFAGVGDATSGQSEREEQELLAGLRNVRFFAYAGRAFVLRFWNLAKVSHTIYLLVVALQVRHIDTTERRFGGHLRRPSWLHSHAWNIRTSLHQHEEARIQLLAT